MLVILGLLVGGVLAGKDLIHAAEVRAQMKQIEGYNIAVRTFQQKYLALPGDMALADALRFNFYRDGTNGMTNTGCATSCGNGDGIIGKTGASSSDDQGYQSGEPHLFWLDLMTSGLSTDTITAIYVDESNVDSTDVKAYLPKGKLGNTYIYAWGNGVAPVLDSSVGSNKDGRNYFSISGVSRFAGYNAGLFKYTSPNIRVMDAYNIDTKIDDGLPQFGNVAAVYIGAAVSQKQAIWVGASSGWGGLYVGGPTTAAVPAAATTCYDNNNTAGQKQQYSFSAANAENCALSFVIK